MKTKLIIIMMFISLGVMAQTEEINISITSVETDTAGIKTAFTTDQTKVITEQTNVYTLDKVTLLIQSCVDDSIGCDSEIEALKQARTEILSNSKISELGKVHKMEILKSKYQKIQKLLGTIVNRKNEYEKVRGVLE